MGWFLAVIVILFVIWLAVASPGFRYVLLFGVAAIGLYFWSAQQQEEKRLLRARSAIKAHEIEISDARLRMESLGNFTATVTNNSKFALRELTLRISIEDCAENGTQCRVVGEDAVSQYLSVPASQARAMNTGAYFSNLPVLKNPRWFYRIETIEAGL